MHDIKLTEFSHGAGCGCKISPAVLDTILQSEMNIAHDARLIVGNQSRDDAAVYDIGSGQGVISTTDFFMPIVDDPFQFGQIAATNAISDIYAMGGKPLMAIAILGWPVNTLPAEVAQQVIEGGRSTCAEAGIPLAGGHSIDSPEPIFGLAVTGMVSLDQLKQNSNAKAGDRLFLTKPLGVGILSTAQKQKKLAAEHEGLASHYMRQLNKVGATLAKIKGLHAMTDVTGFGLLGHLSEVCEGSGLAAEINYSRIPVIPEAIQYEQLGAIPGGCDRNFASYGHKVSELTAQQQHILCDPQTSGGLLLTVDEASTEEVLVTARKYGIEMACFGQLELVQENRPLIRVR